MPLVLKKKEGETWREAMVRVASAHGLEAECTQVFEHEVKHGIPEDEAAWDALYEWDCLDYEEPDEQPKEPSTG